jgi:dethiobiotin synthase
MRRGVFVTGTDTGVGKTLTSGLFLAALRARGADASYFKPVQTGQDDDTETVARLSGASDFPRPAYELALPAAPSRAAIAEGRTIELSRVVEKFRALPDRFWIVEGAGGLLVPLSERGERILTRELVSALGLPLLIVSSTRLGTINHTLLTLESARRAGLEVLGLVLNGDDDPGLTETLRAFDPAPVLARIPELGPVSAERARVLAPELFGRVAEMLCPGAIA